MISSYSSIYPLGHRAGLSLMNEIVFAEEKVDGSQFSFSLGPDGLEFRSKGTQIHGEPDKLFAPAVETARNLESKLVPGWVYVGEALCRPKHNTKTYGRIPKGGFVLFDVRTGEEVYLLRHEKEQVARDLGLEVVPELWRGYGRDLDGIRGLIGKESFLGGSTIEGVVIKPANYSIFDANKKVLMLKLVDDAFKEAHRKSWKAMNPSKSDIVDSLIARYKVERRWEKAVEHLRDDGKLLGTPQDIPTVMKSVVQDILKEEEQEIRDELFKWVWPKISRGVIAGLPEWYKQRLVGEIEKEHENE